MSSPVLFLFDLDGTLVSTGGAGLKALARAFEELFNLTGIVPTIDPSGKTDPAIFRELVRLGLSRDIVDIDEHGRIAQRYLFHLEREMAVASVRVLRGVREIVEHLAEQPNVLVGLGTGNLENGARLKLAPTGLNDLFLFGGFGSDAEERAEVLSVGHRRAEDRAGERISRERVVIIGDTPLDVSAAQRAGFRSIAVASGKFTVERLKPSGADATIEHLGDVFSVLPRFLSPESV